ncbi:MAG: cation-binding protein [Asgard group archaeon]|nr:cation-binding protein [Asgard group archaeon]
MPIAPLMIEHRLIEKMIALMNDVLLKIKEKQTIDLRFIDVAVDFIRIYADKCHHGKEEAILFRELAKKKLSSEHKKIMKELVEEHKKGRKLVGKLVAAKESYISGIVLALNDIVEIMQELVDFYPKHIEKEDKHFFKPVMNYFTQEERDQLLNEEYEFDKGFIHQVYGEIVSKYEKELV